MTDVAVSPPQVIAKCRTYSELTHALRSWFLDELRLTYASIDDIAGLPSGYCAKLFSPIPVHRFGAVSLGPLLGAGGLAIQLVIDEEQLERVRRHSKFRERAVNAPFSKRHPNASLRTTRPHPSWFTSATARIMRARGMLSTTSQQRKKWSRHANAVRWSRREAVAASARGVCGPPAARAPRAATRLRRRAA